METFQTVTGWYYIDIGTEIREAVLEALAPFMSEMRSAMDSLSENVSRISTELEQVKRQTMLVVPGLVPYMNDIKRDIDESTNNLAAEFQREISNLNRTMCRKVSEVVSRIEKHNNKTKAELADIQASVQLLVLNPPTDAMADTVVKKVLPYLNETVESLCEKVENSTNRLAQDLQRHIAGLRSDMVELVSVQDDVANHSHRETGLEKATFLSMLKALNSSMSEQHRSLVSQLEAYKSHTTVEISHLRIILQHAINAVPMNMLHPLQSFVLLHMNNSGEIILEKINVSNDELIDYIRARIETLERTFLSELGSVNDVMRNQHTIMESELQDHKEQVSTGLAELHTTHGTIDSKLDSLESKQDDLKMKVMTVGSEVEANITEELEKTNTFLEASLGIEKEYECGGTFGWRRVVYLDMTKPNASCPSGWRFISYGSKNLCSKANNGGLTCDSVLFPVTGGDYTRVCGSIIGYQKDQIDAFEPYNDGRATTIDSAYVSGVSLTHGYPRQHIWTFAAGASEDRPTWEDACPCDASISIRTPPFVGGDYFCESGVNSGPPASSTSYPDDPLWDGSGCTTSSSCCSFNNPPYFTKQLPNPTSDDIEARLCRWDTGDDSPIEFIELYVKDNQPDTIEAKLDRLESKQDELSRKVTSVSSELETSVLSNITKEMETMRNETKELLSANSDVSEELQNLTVEIQKTNSRLGQRYECGGTFGWRRVVYLDMTKPNANCPPGWQLTSYDSKNLCGKVDTGSLTCDSVLFPVTGGDYTSVCGSIRAYQKDQIDAFEPYHTGQVTTIEGAYVAGVSLTHGSPRQHIWTFAAAATETRTNAEGCPCTGATSVSIPPFVGGDYFCESGVNSGGTSGFHPDDPLWDGSGCTTSSSCCSFNNPPYFTKQLPNPTSDDIEARLCRLSGGDDSPIEFIELYVKDSQPDTIVTKLDRLESKQDELSRKVMNVSSELETNVLSNITKEMETMRNETKELLSVNSELEDRNNITEELQSTNSFLRNYVGQMNSYVCGGTGGWRRALYLDMTDPNSHCPTGWQLTSYGSKRLCGKVSTSSLTCDSVIFPVTGGDYTSVCGSIRAYQYGQIDAFEQYHTGQVTTIEGAYVAGVSLTHGTPRQHIWTFAAAASEMRTNAEGCPCTGASVSIPPFVGGDYFCESGVNSGSVGGFHPDDPLWDGSGCTTSSSCCSFNNPPYFTKRLRNPTSDDIEARLCRWEGGEDSPIEFIELYVK